MQWFLGSLGWTSVSCDWSMVSKATINQSLPATRGALNANLQVVITHASHVCSQHLFGLSLRMNGMHRTQFDRARLDFLLS